MIPEFFHSAETTNNVVVLKTILGLAIVIFATIVGIEIRIGNDDEEI